jgi:hypothetical protein
VRLNAGLSVVTLVVVVTSGCGGSGGADGGDTAGPPAPPTEGGGAVGGGDPSPAAEASCDAENGADGGVRGEEKGGLWVGERHPETTERMRLLVAETGEFNWVSPDGWSQQIFGTLQVDDMEMVSTDAVLVRVEGLTWLETDDFPLDMFGALDEQAGLTFEYDIPAASDTATRVTSNFAACNTLYQRDSSLDLLAGTYVTPFTALTVDGQGEIFYQHGSCVGNGEAELIDPDFNMYRMEIEVTGCTGNTVHAPGRLFSGLAYLGDSGDGGTNDVLEFALSSASAESILVWSQTGQR